MPAYWAVQRPPAQSELPVGDTEDGHAWIGAVNPTLTITEFSDYQCPFCQRGHEHMRQILEDHPDDVRLIHVHFPLDNACNSTMSRQMHPNACLYARMAFCGQQQGKFWDVNDYLFANGRRRTAITVDELAEETGLRRDVLAACVRSKAAEGAVAGDLGRGRAVGVRGTPTFVIDKNVYVGGVPEEVLDKALRQRISSPDDF
jgi:protein-disulfide isomerase